MTKNKFDIAKLSIMLFILLGIVLSSCGVSVKGTCSGNKTMAFYGGYSRKPFNK